MSGSIKARYTKRENKKYRLTDATRIFRFDISEADIKKAVGRQHDKCQCVVAQALQAIVPGLQRVEVGASRVVLFANKTAVRYITPVKLRDGLVNWDASGNWKLPEGEYYLLPPTQCARLETISENNKRRAARLDNRKNHEAKRKYTVNPRFIQWKGGKVVSLENKPVRQIK